MSARLLIGEAVATTGAVSNPMRVRPCWIVPAAAAAVLTGCGGPGLDYNPVAHAVWWVGGAIFGVLVLILLVEVFDSLVRAWRRGRGLETPPSRPQPGDTFHVGEPAGELRERHHRRIRAIRRTFGEGRTEADPESER